MKEFNLILFHFQLIPTNSTNIRFEYYSFSNFIVTLQNTQMANGMERSIDPLVIANLEDYAIPLESIKVGNEVTEESPVKTVESVSAVPEKKSWWARFSKKGDEKKAEENYPPVNPVKIFRYATILELLLMGVGLIAGILQGGAFPLVFLAIGEVLNAFFKFEAVATACSTNYFMNTSCEFAY